MAGCSVRLNLRSAPLAVAVCFWVLKVEIFPFPWSKLKIKLNTTFELV